MHAKKQQDPKIKCYQCSLQSVDRVSSCVQKQQDKVQETGIEHIDVHLCKLIFYILARHLQIW